VIVLAACGAHAAAPAAKPVANVAPVDDRADFQRFASALAAGVNGSVMGWGTAPLGVDATPHDWALIAYQVGNDGKAGYLFESDADTYWFVSFPFEGEDVWGASTSDATPWNVATLRAITWDTRWTDGRIHDEIGLRGGKPVLLAHEVHLTAAEGDTASDEVDKVGPDGEPFDTEQDYLRLVGPASDTAPLVAAMEAEQ